MFEKGLKNAKIRYEIRAEEEEAELTVLARKARRLSSANNIENPHRNILKAEIRESRSRSKSPSVVRSRSKSNSKPHNTEHEKLERIEQKLVNQINSMNLKNDGKSYGCTICGNYYHKAQDCYSNRKQIAKFNHRIKSRRNLYNETKVRF